MGSKGQGHVVGFCSAVSDGSPCISGVLLQYGIVVENCSGFFFQLDALPVTEPTLSRH